MQQNSSDNSFKKKFTYVDIKQTINLIGYTPTILSFSPYFFLFKNLM